MGLIWMYWNSGTRWLWFHRGEDFGANTVAAFCPTDTTAVIVLTNSESWPGTRWIMNVIFAYAQQYGIEEQPAATLVAPREKITATIFRGHLLLPQDKECKVFDITGRVVEPARIQPGIYFIEVDGVVTQKVVKVR